LVTAFATPGGSDQPADPPARHGVGLRDAVEHDGAVGYLRHDDRQRRGLGAVIAQVFVDLVGDHPDVVFGRPPADRVDLRAGVDGARRVGGRVEQQRLRLGRSRRLELLDTDQVAGGLVRGDLHRNAARQGDRLRVGRRVRRGQQHLVARIAQRRERVVDGLLAAVGDDDLRRVDVVAGVARGLLDQRLAQFRQSRRRRVTVIRAFGARARRRVDDVIGCREVRLARAEADYRPSVRLQRLRLGVDRQRRRLGDPGDPCGQTVRLLA
jgi:hypothetical protein